MTSATRVLTALGHREPDRVPLFLSLTMHGAKALGVPIQEYFQSPALMAAGQLAMRERWPHDFLYTFTYAGTELEAFGGRTEFRDDGPPQACGPILTAGDIASLEPPEIAGAPALRRVLESTSLMSRAVAGEALIVGVVMSPFSLPVMQLGFDAYLELLYERPDLAARLHEVNTAFCVSWANAQLAAGANAIGYFDPISSPTILPPEMSRASGLGIARAAIPRIRGPVAALYASGRCEAIMEDVVATGAVIVGASSEEDLRTVRSAAAGRVTVMGNLNAIEMSRWTPEQAGQEVRRAIARAGRGGGFILADTHGEIPWQVSDDVLDAICEAVAQWGRYPLQWIATEEADD